MDNQHVTSYRSAARPSRRVGLVGMIFAGLLLAVGSLFASIGQVLTGLGRRCVDEAAARDLARASRAFRNTSQRGKRAEGWESRLQTTGPLLITSIAGAWLTLWILLLVGGGLFWLVMHGWGLLVLFCTVAIGAVIGLKRARLKQQMPRDELLN